MSNKPVMIPPVSQMPDCLPVNRVLLTLLNKFGLNLAKPDKLQLPLPLRIIDPAMHVLKTQNTYAGTSQISTFQSRIGGLQQQLA